MIETTSKSVLAQKRIEEAMAGRVKRLIQRLASGARFHDCILDAQGYGQVSERDFVGKQKYGSQKRQRT
ncbi:MAG: hypothetical protein WKF84_27560 [Pyrinomonadaceae bacterium]